MALVRTQSSPVWQLLHWFQGVNPLTGLNWLELGRAYRFFIGNPSQGILHILAAERHSNWHRWVMARLARQASLLQDKKITLNLAQLAELPADTLGGAYARHILEQGFDPDAFVVQETRDAWLDHRAALSHDVHHVLTGFDGTPIGEFGLAAFVLVQYRDILNVFVLSHLPWFMLGHPHLIGKTLSWVIWGFRQGWRARPLIAFPFEDNWHRPLAEVRRELRIAEFGRF